MASAASPSAETAAYSEESSSSDGRPGASPPPSSSVPLAPQASPTEDADSGQQRHAFSLFSPFIGIASTLNAWVGSAAGYDEKILEAFGTPTDEKRRRNIGRAIVVATLVGSLGWLVKISLAMPAPYGIVVGLVISGLYGVLSYSLESFFAANVNPYASLWSKFLSLLGRSLLSALIAFSGALPWVTMSLKGSIHLEMAKLAQSEQLAMRDGIDKIHGLTGLGARSAAMQSELAQWNGLLSTLPAPVTAALAGADQCDAQSETLIVDTGKKVDDLNTRLGLLAKLEANAIASAASALSSGNSTARTRDSESRLAVIRSERRAIGKRTAELNKTQVDKKSECVATRADANTARDSHLKMATKERQSAQVRLSKQREVEQAAMSGAQKDTAQADEVTKLALSENSAGEFTALVSLIKTQFYAQFLGALIFMGLFMVDVLPLTLRLFARPGPYDAEKRSDDAIRMMRAEGRRLQAELIHSARCIEIGSEDFKNQLQKEVRPHIRSIALNDVSRFVSKQKK